MSSGAPYQGYNPQPQQGTGYYGAQPQGQVVMVPVQAGAGTYFGPWGQNRTIALVGALIAALGLVLPWLSFGFFSVSGLQILSLGGLLASAGGGLGALLVISVLLALIGALLALPFIVFRYNAKGMKLAMLGSILGFVGAILFLLTGLGTGSSISFVGFGLWMTIIGNLIGVVGCAKAAADFSIPPGYTAAQAAAAMAPETPTLEWGGAGTYSARSSSSAAAPSYSAPAPSYSTPAQQYPCPQCQGPVTQGAAQCASCGLALTW